MATYNVTERNPENTEIIAARLLSFDDAAQSQPAALNQVSPKGTVTSGALSTQQLVSTTGAQVSTARDVELHTLVTFDATNAVATVAVALSPDNSTYSTLYTLSLAAAVNNTGAIALPIAVRVPAGWYVKMTTSHGTLGLSTYY
jgi:hypothetical protein